LNPKWDRRFLELARHVAAWSKDPSTQVGAVVAEGKRVVSLGYNGFAAGVNDDPARYLDRDTKYKLVVHAERNAILFARRDLKGCTLYTHPFSPCAQCAALVIQSGIKRVVAPEASSDVLSRWGDDIRLAKTIFDEVGVDLVTYLDKA
jgi:dCMP deaminase